MTAKTTTRQVVEGSSNRSRLDYVALGLILALMYLGSARAWPEWFTNTGDRAYLAWLFSQIGAFVGVDPVTSPTANAVATPRWRSGPAENSSSCSSTARAATASPAPTAP